MNIMKFMRKSKFFTLIELIVVIVVLGILAAIVIPNISSFKEEAEETAILSDARNIQTAVDMFMLKNDGRTPTKDTPTLGNPQIVETYGMKPDYLRDLPKTKRAKFWLDQNNTVWASMVDAPTNVDYVAGKVTWDTVDGAELYKIYKSEDATTASIKKAKGMKFIDDVTPNEGENPSKELPALATGTYLVTAIDKFDFESAPTKVKTDYTGYGEGPDKDFMLTNPKVPETPAEPANEKPTAVITMSPDSNIDSNTFIQWDYSKSTDPEGDDITNFEWKNQQPKYNTGEYTVELRVQDSKGNWSDWVSKKIIVEEAVVFTSGTFTNAGATGQYGPNQAQIDSAYINSSLKDQVISEGGIQIWTVPNTGKYSIQAFGAQGGGNYGGKGAIIKGDITLTKGDKLKILVGQRGTNAVGQQSGSNHGGGGGGGTFITTTNNTPIIVAGGGGGGSGDNPSFVPYYGDDASLTANGTSTYQTGGGTNGEGGKTGITDAPAAGGGGFFFGGYSTSATGSQRLAGAGSAFIHGGYGGQSGTSNTSTIYHGGDGGFGGGAGGMSNGLTRGGGAGGYSGGQGGTYSSSPKRGHGGGGGSYNSGTNQSNSVGNTGHGKVIITYLGQ